METSSASAPLPDPDVAAILTSFPLIVMPLWSVFWSDTADDATMISKFQEFSECAEIEARARGLLNRFLYANSAPGT